MTHFRIGHQTFDISSARLVPFFDVEDEKGDFLVFGVELQAASRDVYWSAQLVCDELIKQAPGTIRSFRDLCGRSGEWSEGEDDEGEPRGLLITTEHELVYNAHWQFGRGVGGALDFRFSGTSDFAHGDDMAGPLRLDISCPLAFDAIPCARRSEAECRELVRRFDLQDDFRYSRDQHGVSQLIPVD